jgi:tetratricopeptide (TPR) repeat protein
METVGMSEEEENKPLTDEQKRKAISELKSEIAEFPKLRKSDIVLLTQLIDLEINLSYLLSEFPESYNESIDEFSKALQMAQNLEDNTKIAFIKGAIASIYYAKRDFMNAAQYYKESIDILKGTPYNNEIMVGQKGLGLSLMSLGDEITGIKSLLDAAQTCAEMSDIDNYMEIITLLKVHYTNKKDWEMIIELETKALKILKDIGNHHEIAISHMEIGLSHVQLKNYDDALKQFKQAVNSAIEEGDNLLIYQCIILVAETFFHMRQIDRAIDEYLRALSLVVFLDYQEEVQKTKLVLQTLGVPIEKIENAVQQGLDERKKAKKIKT